MLCFVEGQSWSVKLLPSAFWDMRNKSKASHTVFLSRGFLQACALGIHEANDFSKAVLSSKDIEVDASNW